jgi:RNA polymerase sigma-70 factor (sigma-E family)
MNRGPSFDEYVAAHGRALERYAYVLVGQPAAAQDLVQTALIKVYRRWRRISGMDYPDAYVRRILTNCYVDLRRSRTDAERPLADIPDYPTGVDLAAGVVVRDELVRALDSLSPQQRAVIVLRHFLGEDDAAIAAELGCTQATVRSHAARGLQRMRTALGTADSAEQPDPVTDPGFTDEHSPDRRLR